MTIELKVLGEPKAQMRHKAKRIGKFINMYDPSEEDKRNFFLKIQDNAPEKPIDMPIRLELFFYFSRPKNHYGSGRNQNIIKDSAPKYHISRPDVDNCSKLIMDSLNKIYWRDDSLIYELTVKKLYDEMPRTEIYIHYEEENQIENKSLKLF